jgi:beta-glucosidase
VNPSGKLCFTYPAAAGNSIPYYHKKSEAYNPEFTFGHGLSYTTYQYSDFTISGSPSANRDPFEVSVKVHNSGEMEGRETIFLYLEDPVGKITRPVRKLIDFQKISLQPGEGATVSFEIDPRKQFAYPDEDGVMILEPGEYILHCGDMHIGMTLD